VCACEQDAPDIHQKTHKQGVFETAERRMGGALWIESFAVSTYAAHSGGFCARDAPATLHCTHKIARDKDSRYFRRQPVKTP
jgi:hypothetical protein